LRADAKFVVLNNLNPILNVTKVKVGSPTTHNGHYLPALSFAQTFSTPDGPTKHQATKDQRPTTTTNYKQQTSKQQSSR